MTLYSPISSIYSSRAEQQPFFLLASNLLQPAHCLLLILLLSTSTRSRTSFTNAHIFTVVKLASERNKISPQCIFHIPSTLPQPPCSSFSFPARLFLYFDFYSVCCFLRRLPLRSGLGKMKCSHWGEGTNRQWLQMEFGQWSEIPIQKIDFVHKLEFEVSKGRITQVLHQVSAILWLLAPGHEFGWLIIRQDALVHLISTWQPPTCI